MRKDKMCIAIIGASVGQKALCIKAKEMELRTIGFAWADGAICADLFDKFYPISIFEIDKIVGICKNEKVDGVISNASEITIDVVAEVSKKLCLHEIGPLSAILNIQNKAWTRKIANNIEGLEPVPFFVYGDNVLPTFPCIVKPCTADGKSGVSFVNDDVSFKNAVKYASAKRKNGVLVESYIKGSEISVESISYNGKHYVLQITDKENTGHPHFVEIAHHEPSALPNKIQQSIKKIIPKLLDAVGFKDGATHTEMKISRDEKIYLIEINPRGGGDEISNTLVNLSTNCDYVKMMIEVSLGIFSPPKPKNIAFSGIYFLCKQTQNLLPFFENAKDKDYLVEEKIFSNELKYSHGNAEHDGYLIYRADKKIIPT